MDGCFLHCLWFITTLLSNPSNALIFTMQASHFGCLILFICCLSCLILFHTHTHKYRQLPHAPENPIAVLSASEKRAINLTWAQAFDGNSPLIRYILEVSENSKAPVSPSAPRVAQMHLLCLVSHFKSNIVTSYSLEELICCPSYYITFPWCPQNWQLRPLLPSAISLTRLPHLCASSASDPREPNCVDAGELISHFFFFFFLPLDKIKEVGTLFTHRE